MTAASDSSPIGSHHSLVRHPASPCDAVAGIAVDVSRGPANALRLRYTVRGDTSALRLPLRAAPARKDALWEHTCFEAFVRPARGASYFEFNFSPSTEWAAYRFEAYREGMRAADEGCAPQIQITCDWTCFVLETSFALPCENLAWHLSLSAVIEETSGRRSWWALAHPPGKPDFHHHDGFVLELAAPGHGA